MHVLVIKIGAMGDVVRTSYLVNALAEHHGPSLRLTWLTDPSCFDLIRFNPYIHTIGTLDSLRKSPPPFVDWVLSLDDERPLAEFASGLKHDDLTGAYVDEGRITYTDDVSEWFDMGLVSRLGRNKADRLKKDNNRTHGEIFAQIFRVKSPKPQFFGNPILEAQWREQRAATRVVAFNFFAGIRWPAKEMPPSEAIRLVDAVRDFLRRRGERYRLVFLSDHTNIPRAQKLIEKSDSSIWDCSRSALDYAAAIKACDYIFSTDSLGMHLAIGQKIPNLSFFAPTSGQEIDTFGTGVKVCAEGPDYCSYNPNADNSTLTANRIFAAWRSHLSTLPEWQ